jgi:membrane-associated phospholipid phosphatase
MHWLLALDTALFHFINGSLGNPLFDWLMPILSGAGGAMHWFVLAAVLVFAAAVIFGDTRARICALMIFLAVALGDGLVVNTIKHAVHRTRPGIALPDTVMRLGSTTSGSMPSAHAANWFAATMIVFIFYRRKRTVFVPVALMATAVAFSRVYNGVHYPSDVLAGAILGSGYAAAIALGLEWIWQSLGQRWFPLWHARMPSLLNPEMRGSVPDAGPAREAGEDGHWLRLAYVLIVLTFIGRLFYEASGTIQLSGDEVYQWLWSKHLALSYYSKPPGIALIQFTGTMLFGDTAFGIRFFSPVFAAMLSWITVRFMAREAGGKVAFWFLLAASAIPLLAAGAVLITVDPPLVLCWTWALVAGWRAVQADSRTRDWVAVGVAMGLGFLCKYNAMYQIICFGIFFALWAPARGQLRKSGPWLALGIFLICTLPVLIWNAQHAWITVHHVAGNAGLNNKWSPSWKYIGDFWGSEAGVLNPIFFIAALWAAFSFWKRRHAHPLMLYLFCMSAPVFFGHALYAIRERILPNWIAPAMPGMFMLMALYWSERAREGSRLVKPFLVAGLAIGFLLVAVMYDTNLIEKVMGAALPGPVDPVRRLSGWKEEALLIESEREKLEAGGKPAFIIAGDYGMASQFTFYSPVARKAAALQMPIVYCADSAPPSNEFYFWPKYDYKATHKGDNALLIVDLGAGKPERGWLWKWLKHEKVTAIPPPPMPAKWLSVPWEFQSFKDLGVQDVSVHGQVLHHVQIWACYNLK